jgi:hypothetical protein
MQFKKSFVFVIALVGLDVLCIFIYLLDLLWAGSSNYICFGDIFIVIIAYPVFVVYVVYFVCAMCLKRTAYIRTIGLFFTITVVSCYWLHGLSLKRHDLWFIRHGVKGYSECVEDIKLNEKTLTRVNHKVNHLISDPNIVLDGLASVLWTTDVYASTNFDGSLFVMFANRSDLPDTEYIFYNGTNIVAGSHGRWTINGGFGPYRLIFGPWYEY